MDFLINEKIKQYLIISGISLVVSLYLFEGYLTFKAQLSKEQIYEKQTGKKFDIRTLNQIYEDLKKNNDKIKITVHRSYYLNKNFPIHPLSGISNSETIHCNENGYYSIYKSDRYGFNNPDEEWYKKEIEYFLVGDSFTHGNCVNRPNDIASVLRILSNKAVLNLGQSGNGPLSEYANLREYLNSNVKKILWIYYEQNDLEDLKKELSDKNLINYLNNLNFSQNLKLKQNEINKLIEDILDVEIKKYTVVEKEQRKKNQKIKYKILKFIRLDKTKKVFTNYQIKQESANQILEVSKFQEILKLTKDLVAKNNAKLYFIYLPEINRYKLNYNNANYDLVKNIVTELNIPFIDMHKEVFEKEQNQPILFSLEPPVHYNVEGYKKVAETIHKFTKD